VALGIHLCAYTNSIMDENRCSIVSTQEIVILPLPVVGSMHDLSLVCSINTI